MRTCRLDARVECPASNRIHRRARQPLPLLIASRGHTSLARRGFVVASSVQSKKRCLIKVCHWPTDGSRRPTQAHIGLHPVMEVLARALGALEE